MDSTYVKGLQRKLRSGRGVLKARKGGIASGRQVDSEAKRMQREMNKWARKVGV